MKKKYTVPDDIVEAAGPEKSNRTFAVLLVLLPAIAIWHPITAEGAGANLIAFWSWFYCLVGTPLNLVVLLGVMFAAEKIDAGALLGVCRKRLVVMRLVPLGGLAWTLGAAARGWMWTAALLGACWVAGVITRALIAEGAKRELIKRFGDGDRDANETAEGS